MSITTAPANTLDVTASIEVSATGTAYLRVNVDGELVTLRYDVNRLILRDQTVTDEADRLLQRHAGYHVGTAWDTDERGRLTATVAEITGRCTVCVHGCGCGVDSVGCEHYLCPASSDDTANACDGAALALSAKRPPLRGARYARPRHSNRRDAQR